MANIRYEVRIEGDEVEVNNDQMPAQKLMELLAGHMKMFYPGLDSVEMLNVEGGQLVIIIGEMAEPEPEFVQIPDDISDLDDYR